MSHFSVAVVIEEGGDIEDVEEALAKYNEGTEVPEYVEQCYCVGKEAQNEVAILADEKFGTWDKIREEFHNRKDIKKLDKRKSELDNKKKPTKADKKEYAKIEKEIQTEWSKIYDAKESFIKKATAKHEYVNEPDKTCTDCHGTGLTKSTYNPLSKWDWYEVGGRWDGFIGGKANQTTVKEYLKVLKKDFEQHITRALIVNGEWYENSKMGWFGMTHGEGDEKAFKKKCIELLEGCDPDDIVVGVDAHI